MLSHMFKKIGAPFAVLLTLVGCSNSGNVGSSTGEGGAGGAMMPSFATSNYSAALAGGSIPTATEADAVVGVYPASVTACSGYNNVPPKNNINWAAPLLSPADSNSLLTMTAADNNPNCVLSIKSFKIAGSTASSNSGTYVAGTVSATGAFTSSNSYMPVSIVTTSGTFSATQAPIAFSNCTTNCSASPTIIYAKASIFWTATPTATISIVFADSPTAASGTGNLPTTSVVSVTGGGVNEVPTPNYTFPLQANLPQLTVDASGIYQSTSVPSIALTCSSSCVSTSSNPGGASSYTIIPGAGVYSSGTTPYSASTAFPSALAGSYNALFVSGATPANVGYSALHAYYNANKTTTFTSITNPIDITINMSDFIVGTVGATASAFGGYKVPNSIRKGGFVYYVLIVNDVGSGKPPAFEVATYTQPRS